MQYTITNIHPFLKGRICAIKLIWDPIDVEHPTREIKLKHDGPWILYSDAIANRKEQIARSRLASIYRMVLAEGLSYEDLPKVIRRLLERPKGKVFTEGRQKLDFRVEEERDKGRLSII